MTLNKKCRMFKRSRCASDNQRNIKFAFFQHGSNRLHLCKRRSDKTAQADGVSIVFFGGGDDFFSFNHHTEVDDFVIIAAQNDTDYIFADIVDVAFDGGKHDGSCFDLSILTVKIRSQQFDCIFHGAGGFDDLREKHFAVAEKSARLTHTVHESSFNDFQCGFLLQSLLQIFIQKCVVSVNESIFQALITCHSAPFGSIVNGFFRSGIIFDFRGKFEQFFVSVSGSIENDRFDRIAQFNVNIIINIQLGGIDDCHAQTGFDCMIQENAVHGTTDFFIAPERE